jgi:hypothetical protein
MLLLCSHSIESVIAGEPATVMLSIGNVGHVIAANLYYGIECLFIDRQADLNGDILHVLCEMPLRRCDNTLEPSHCLDLHFSLAGIHKNHVTAVDTGGHLLLILARFEYAGSSGDYHWSNICLQYDGRAITIHDKYNDVDAAPGTARWQTLPDHASH